MENKDDARFCQNCGANLKPGPERYCPACGAPNVPQATFCEDCGVPLEKPAREGYPEYGAPPPRVEERFVYAGFWLRFVAYLIDGFILNIVFLPLYFIFIIPAVATESMGEEAALLMLPCICGFNLLIIAISWLYFAFMESSPKQGTLGKMALGIIVTDMDGNRISFGKASGRFFGKIVSGLIFYIGYILAGFTEKKQALHDMLASCLVIMKR